MAVIWRILLAVSLVFSGFVAGAWLGGNFLVKAGAGLAGPVEVLGYGVIGAVGALLLCVLGGFFRLQGPRLRTLSLVSIIMATALFALMAILVLEKKNLRGEPQEAALLTGGPTTVMERRDDSEADHFDTLAVNTAVSPVQNCAPTQDRHAARVHGDAAGEHNFAQSVGPGWTFMLQTAPHGWDVRLLDHNGMDLSQITPPFRLAPNPRELYGWHFRNAANTGANTGDINAPQHVRSFQFSPSLTGTGGFKPSAPFSTPDETQGRGVLTIVDMALANLQPGAKAQMSYIKFVACLTWPKIAE